MRTTHKNTLSAIGLVFLMTLGGSSSAFAFDELHLEWDFFIRGGGVLVDSVGLATRAGASPDGVVTVDELPDRATITQAFLYWMTIGGSGDSEATLDGIPIVGTQVGDCEDTCWNIGPNYVYRADVTQYVNTPGDYVVGGVGNGDTTAPDGQGATILAFYDDPSADNAGFVKIYEGARDNMSGPGSTEATYTTFDGLYLPVEPVRAEMTWSVGDSQSFPDGQTTFEGVVLATDNFDETEHGPLWDTDEWDVLSYMSAGMSEVTAGLSVGGSSDCLAIGLAILEYDLPCEFDGDGDGSGICDDCDDEDPDISDVDLDGDGRSQCTGDCDDTEPTVYAGHPEICDGLDNDCDGVTPGDEFEDVDGDGYLLCDDCNDEQEDVNPGAEELCDNAVDDDCDGQVDEEDCAGGDDDDAGDDDDSAGGDDDDDGGGGRRTLGCSCDAAAPVNAVQAKPLGLAALLLLLLGGRRRSSRAL